MPARTDLSHQSAELLSDGRRLRLSGSLLIGRAPDAGIVLDSDEVSRHHARIEQRDDGGYLVTDLDSKNGTYVNGARIAPSTVLEDGDEVYVGGHRFRFLCSSHRTHIGESGQPASTIRCPLPPGQALTLGRAADNDLVLDNPNVSRFHAEIVTENDTPTIRDLGSRNGVFVNGQPVGSAHVRPGDRVRIGSFHLELEAQQVLAHSDTASLQLRAEEIAVQVDGKQILAPTSLQVAPGELTAIIGESGSGKTTLIRALAGVSPPTSGRVIVGDEDIRTRLTETGYVPQHEIVHGRLSIEEALVSAAQLRLPPDTGGEEIEARVEQVLAELSLLEHRHTRVERLSGGQRRRVGIAVELVGQPSLLFLDEPTTGLDPLLESRAMELLRDLATDARAVVLVTHTTQNLALCDKLVVMGSEGHLVFVGRPSEALEFFRAESLSALYEAVASRPAREWRRLFEEVRTDADHAIEGERASMPPASPPRVEPRTDRARQARILLRRYMRTFSRDRRNMLILFGQVPLIAAALIGLFGSDVFAAGTGGTPKEAAQLLFLLVTLAIWFGLLDASRELVKERSIFQRERAIGVRVGTYLASKVTLLFGIGLLQVVALASLVFAFRPLHEQAPIYLGLLAALLLVSLCAITLGLCVSAVVNSEDQATSFVPLLLVPQLFFAGAIIPAEKMSAAISIVSEAVFAKWAFALSGSLIAMNERLAASPGVLRTSEFGSAFFATPHALAYFVLAVFSVVFLAFTFLLLARQR